MSDRCEPNPRTAGHALGSRIRTAQDEFNLAYCTILQLLDQTFDGNPQMLGPAIGAMFRLKEQANALMQIPTEDGLATAGPTFEYVAPADRRQSMSQIRVRMTRARDRRTAPRVESARVVVRPHVRGRDLEDHSTTRGQHRER